MNWSELVREFVTLFVVIDPIGTVPVFLYATKHIPASLHWRFAVRGIVVATIVLFVFLLGGQFVLEALGLRLGSFQVAGGIVLFLFALSMVLGDSKPSTEIEKAERDHLAGAVFPLAMPSIASPGAMLAIVILTDNHKQSLLDQSVTGLVLLAVILLTLVLLLLATWVQRLIGTTGASVISRVMGIILVTVAVDSVMVGLDVLGVLHISAPVP